MQMNTGMIMTDWRILTAFTVLSWGGYNIILKLISGRIAWQLSMLIFVVGYTLVTATYCFLNFPTVSESISKPAVLLALSSGILCGLGAVAFFKALPIAPGSILMPLVGLYVLVAATGCLIILKEPVSLRVISGIVLAVISIMLLGK